MTIKSVFSISAILVALVVGVCDANINHKCAPIYGQCGGKGYTGPTCCEQPKPTALLPFVPFRSVICEKTSPDSDYAQCKYQCSYDEPCLASGYFCRPPAGTNGAGLQYCPYQTSCTNPNWCYTVQSSVCICRGDVPCRLNTRPGGCYPKIMKDGKSVCPPVSQACPAFEGEQCGGKAHVEPTTCQEGLKCVKYSEYYSGCEKM